MVNRERTERIAELLHINRLDLTICALPANVVMLSGYWPVVGSGIAVATAGGRVSLLIPEDEAELAQSGWADDVRTFRPGSLETLRTVAETIRKPLTELLGPAAAKARIGFEDGEISEPASYAGLHLYGGKMARLLADCLPHATLSAADNMLAELRAQKTPVEIDRLRVACKIAGDSFRQGAGEIACGASESEAANAFRGGLGTGSVDDRGVQRADGFAWCMSGPNSALAAGAYARSRARTIQRGDLVLIHCNSYADGYWTDITRTYCVGAPDARQTGMYDAVLEAEEAALQTIRPGASAASVDRAARDILSERGFGDAFKHSTGHGVGFEAISANALPRLHPQSPDVLRSGMVFNVEPAVYFEGYGGIRHCNMVAVGTDGYELLTPFQCEEGDLFLEAGK